jgi:uracil-DNA glycosylase
VDTLPGWDAWRLHARGCLQQGVPPHQVVWQTPDAAMPLLALPLPLQLADNSPAMPQAMVPQATVPKAFMEAAQLAICHQSPDRFALLYRLLWRITHENRQLLSWITDDDVVALNRLIKAVRRDAYKIKAFLRFREASTPQGKPHFVAWYQPEHYTLELSAPFFQTRFRNITWSILTPYRAAHWDGHRLTWADNPDPSIYPAEDAVEAYWLNYYASTFNPARLKPKAMLSQMPKKYWRNMPETQLIPGLMAAAQQRVQTMLQNRPSDNPTPK